MTLIDDLIACEASKICSSSVYGRLKQKAWDSFLKLGLPKHKQEQFRYFPLAKLYQKEFLALDQESSLDKAQEFLDEEHKNCRLVFVNGAYCAELSHIADEAVQMLDFEEALKLYASFIQGQWTNFLKQEKNPFSLLNAALHQKAAFVYVSPNTVLDQPLRIYHIQTQEKQLFQARLHLVCAKNSSIDLSFFSKDFFNGSWGNHSFDIFLEAGANLRLLGLCSEEAQQQFRVIMKRQASARLCAFAKGGEMMGQNFDVQLLEEGASVSLEGANYLDGEAEVHQNCFVEHHAPSCRSEQRFKNVLNANSRASFQAKTYIHPQAQLTDATQLNENLLLSDEARVETVPNLEIFADDVRASHGATIAQIDAEKLQYLQSRGISKVKAEKFLVQAFLNEMQERTLKEEFQSFFSGVFDGA